MQKNTSITLLQYIHLKNHRYLRFVFGFHYPFLIVPFRFCTIVGVIETQLVTSDHDSVKPSLWDSAELFAVDANRGLRYVLWNSLKFFQKVHPHFCWQTKQAWPLTSLRENMPYISERCKKMKSCSEKSGLCSLVGLVCSSIQMMPNLRSVHQQSCRDTLAVITDWKQTRSNTERTEWLKWEGDGKKGPLNIGVMVKERKWVWWGDVKVRQKVCVSMCNAGKKWGKWQEWRKRRQKYLW